MEIKKINKNNDGCEEVSIINKEEDFVIHINQNISLHIIKTLTGDSVHFTTYNDVKSVRASYSGKCTKMKTIDYEVEE